MRRLAALVLGVAGFLLLAVNLWGVAFGGLHREARPLWVARADPRLDRGPVTRSKGESDMAFVRRASESVHRRLAVYWLQGHQQVPPQENWVLWAISLARPSFRDYQFTDSERAFRRGVGLCGQFALAGFDVLEQSGLHPRMVLLPGHTFVTARPGGREVVVDPEFGLVIPHTLAQVLHRPELVRRWYASLDPAATPLKYEPSTTLINLDYSDVSAQTRRHARRLSRGEVADFMVGVYGERPLGVYSGQPTPSRVHAFEPVSYWLKWLVPVGMLAVAVMILVTGRRAQRGTAVRHG